MPRTWEDFFAYAAEIRVDLGNGRMRSGSGYVVSPCRILTALHVLIGQQAIETGAKILVPGEITVRAHGDFEVDADTVFDRGFRRVRTKTGGDYGWRPAKLVWPAGGADVPRYDVAVLEVEVTDDEALEHLANAPRVICLGAGDGDVNCRGTGFAKWAEITTKERRELANPCTVSGFLTAGAERYRACRAFTVTNGGPEDPSDWSGLSGAVFFDDNTRSIVGIPSEVRNTKTNNGLWITRLADLADDEGLEDFWTMTDLMPPNSAALLAGAAIRPIRCPHQPSHNPCAYLHQFDRAPQVDRVFKTFQPAESSEFDPNQPRLPPIFLICGRLRDLPQEMIRRLRDEVAESLLGDRVPSTQSLQWRSKENAADGVGGLQRDIVYHLTRSKQIVDLSKIVEKAQGQDWTLEIDVCQTDARDIVALARFLKLFASFGAWRSPPALYVVLFAGGTGMLAKEDPRIQRFLKDLAKRCARFADQITLIKDVFLDDCDYTHIHPWVEFWKVVCEETTGPYSDYLELSFQNARPYPLRRFKETLAGAPVG